MLFHSLEFLLLLALTFVLFYSFPKIRMYLLFAANIIFYGVSGVKYLIVFMLVSYFTYFCSNRLSARHGKIYFYAGLLVNVLNLMFFKYTGFILENIDRFLGISMPWQNSLVAKIILPVGISFYTFQLIAYLVDVWRKDIEPCKSFLTFWVFISFFAQLIAGPIMRGSDFIPQVVRIGYTKLSESRIKFGIYYISRGFIKKIIFADTLAPIVAQFYSNAAGMGTMDAWYATYLFAFQIFFDFSAYSEFAMGIGHLFGFNMDVNFKTPYVSSNPKEFWKRWHITLSSWIRDYIYIPMGGGKKSFILKCLFVLIAMMISGMWHGAKWTFIIWGAYHGMLSVMHNTYIKYFSFIREKFKNNVFYKIVTTFVFFQLTNIGWVFFRANGFTDAMIIIRKMFSFSNISYNGIYGVYLVVVMLLYLVHLAEYWVSIYEIQVKTVWTTLIPAYMRAAIYAVIVMLLIVFTTAEESTFIYFQF